MNSTVSTVKSIAASPASGAASDAWNELVGAMPIVVLYRALRDALRRNAHKRAVLEAFRR